MKDFFYKVNDKEYQVVIVHKRIKRVYIRFIDGKFYISCHPLTSKKFIIQVLDKYAEKLSKNDRIPPIGDDYIYLFGNKVEIADSGLIKIDDYLEIHYNDKEELSKKLKPIFLDIITKRVRYYEEQMNLPTYRVTVRNMKTRYGSNSKTTKTIHFSTTLIHYSLNIIDAIIVHELAHIVEFNHSKAFYDVVYKYCPDYKRLHKLLRKGVYHD